MVLKSTKNSPEVHLNLNSGILMLVGRSFMENPTDFYNSIIEELKDGGDSLNVTMEFDYVNTSSVKCLLHLLRFIQSNFNEVIVTWSSEEGDEDNVETGEHLAESTGLDFEFKDYMSTILI